MLAIASACRRRGCTIRVYTPSWQGDQPSWLEVRVLACAGLTNHGKVRHFVDRLSDALASDPVDLVVGFNKMPGLDVYYAADGCYKAKALAERGALYRMTGRYRQYQAFEEAVFGPDSRTQILIISEPQAELFVRCYHTPQSRMHRLPPNVSHDRCAPPNADEVRASFRQEFGLGPQDRLLLMIGSWFSRKGVDRSIHALAALPSRVSEITRLFVVGTDDSRGYLRLARRLGVDRQIRFLGARGDVARFLLGADLLLHPARYENTGTVIVEALAAGLPSIVSGACGYAHYVQEAEAGWVIPEPLDQEVFNRLVHDALTSGPLLRYRENALAFAAKEDLYGMVDAAVAVIEKVLADRLAVAACP